MPSRQSCSPKWVGRQADLCSTLSWITGLTVNSVSTSPTGRLTLATALMAACCAAAALVASSNSCSSVLSSACRSVGKTAPLLLALKGGTVETAFSVAPPPGCRADLEPGWSTCSHHVAQHCPAATNKLILPGRWQSRWFALGPGHAELHKAAPDSQQPLVRTLSAVCCPTFSGLGEADSRLDQPCVRRSCRIAQCVAWPSDKLTLPQTHCPHITDPPGL